MFADYQSQVLLTYHEKKAAGALSQNLINSTPARLRDECVAVFHQRYDHHEDEKTLSIFFSYQENEGAYLRAIQRFDTDKFKPLDRFLKGLIADTHPKNIELLAWLIDFGPRPYRWDFDYSAFGNHVHQPAEFLNVADRTLPEKTLTDNNINSDTAGQQDVAFTKSPYETPVLPGENKRPPVPDTRRLPLKKKTMMLLLIIPVSIVVYLALRPVNGPEQCMCWTGDHYQQVSCGKQLNDRAVYALDTFKLDHFKKITKPDTISPKAIGHTWYSKIDNVVEFFTSDGFHPVHVDRKLKPLTEHIRTRYIPYR
jgi:hypothetical protein